VKVIQISDEVYDKLKSYIVDPFEDTPEFVIRRLIEIADKAKSRWSSWDAPGPAEPVNDAPRRAEPVHDTPRRARAVESGEPRAEPPRHNWKQQAEPIL
jgi:hypothetical protein